MAKDAVSTIVQVFKEYDGLHPRTIALTGCQGQLDGLDKAIEEGMKAGDIDPRGEREYCYLISDKARAIAGGVLEAILHSLKGLNLHSS